MQRERRTTLHHAAAAAVACAAAALMAPATFSQFAEPDVTVLRTHTADTPGGGFGFVAEAIGDINGDGASEYIIGEPYSNAGGPLSGEALLYSGADGSLLHVVVGQPYNVLGYGVAAPGDVNGDGVKDYAVTGRGSPAGPAPRRGRLLVLSGADNSVILDVPGPGDLDLFGYDVNAAGDVNHDGHPDLIVGAPYSNVSYPIGGSVYVISGADGSVIWERDGLSAYGGFGAGVSGLGDLNGDGVPEQAAAAPGGGKDYVGEAYVLSGADGSILRVMKPKKDGWNFGNFFVHDVGDVDGNGLDDIFIGDFGNLSTGADTGHAYIFLSDPQQTRRIIDGEHPGDGFGIGRGAGDVDGDGHPDYFLAAFLNSDGAPQGGKGYVYSGRNDKLIRTMTGTVPGAELGFDAIALGDVNNDGLIDFLITGVDVAYVVAGNPAP